MDTAAVINSDWRTMVPLRFVAEALGCSVDYTTHADGSTDQVIIKGAAEDRFRLRNCSDGFRQHERPAGQGLRHRRYDRGQHAVP